MNSKNFYNEISGIYGQMIDFEKNLQLRVDAYKNIFPVKGKVVDIGCGVGLDSIALAVNGHKVTSLDISPGMIQEAKKNAGRYDVDINAKVGSFNSISKNYFGKFDYAVSVGNTIAHLKPGELKKAVMNINKILMPGGKLFLHILNYELIMKKAKRINNIACRDGKIIIRFYDFGKRDIDFNVLSFPVENQKDYNLVTTKHYPHKKSEIKTALLNAGFVKIKFIQNFSGGKFKPAESKDMFISTIKT